MKTIHKISGIFLWCVVGVFLGKSVYTYYDYTAHPGLYETWSAPWYTGILRDGVIAAVLIAVTLADLCYAWENERSITWIPKAP